MRIYFYTRFRITGGTVTQMRLESYRDFLFLMNYPGDIPGEPVGKFALTTLDSKAFNRLEDPSRFVIDNSWPQFNGGTTVKTANYHGKWQDPAAGIGDAVKEYLRLSKNDMQAATILESQTPGDDTTLPVSYLSMLNLAASDYHIARMLGLGHIDTPSAGQDNGQKYIYVARYAGKPELSNEPDDDDPTDYVYMSLPTGRSDFRRPPRPGIREITYGLNIEGDAAAKLFDRDGYSKMYDVRFINIGREKYVFERNFESFFQSEEPFCTCRLTQAYTLRYRIQSAAGVGLSKT